MLFTILFTLPVTGLFYLFYSKYNHVYKKFQTIYSNYQLTDTPEFQDPITLKLTSGQVPTWLNGIMYRIGPGKFNIKQKDGSTFSIKHAFDGLPFCHRFQINGTSQTLQYNSRLLSRSIERDIEEGKSKGSVFFGHVAVVSFSQFVVQAYHRLDTLVLRAKPEEAMSPDSRAVGVTVTPNFPLPSHWKKEGLSLVTKTDANILQKIDPVTLVPEKVFNYTTYDKQLKGQFSAAHHQWDPKTNEIFNFTLLFAPKPRMVVFSANQDGKIKVLADITQRTDKTAFQAPYIHSLWLSENYVIVPESPLTYGDKGINMLLTGAALSSMIWKEGAPTYLHVIDRQGGGLVASIPVPGFFTFHVANAFETTDENGDTILTLDCASFSNGNIMHQLHQFGGAQPKRAYTAPQPTTHLNGIPFPPSRQSSFGDFKRYKLNITQKKFMMEETLCKNVEFPRYNQKYSFRDHQFVYGCQLSAYTEKEDESNGLVKIDLKTKQIIRYDGQEGFYCSEPIFVPHPEARSEDEGVLLSLVNNTNCCYLVVVDAIKMVELARFTIGQFTAVTFHGSYVDHEFESINVN